MKARFSKAVLLPVFFAVGAGAAMVFLGVLVASVRGEEADSLEPRSEQELRKRIASLEKRVAELERKLATQPAAPEAYGVPLPENAKPFEFNGGTYYTIPLYSEPSLSPARE